MQLAQLNIGRVRYDFDDPRLADFMDNLERVNGIADRSPGFVWRLKDDTGNATNIRISDDPRLALNMSVWQDAETFEQFVWQTVHKRFYERKAEWFDPHAKPYFVMWWVEDGRRPSVEEALERLDHLTAHGSTDFAFGWEQLPNVTLWMSQRCA